MREKKLTDAVITFRPINPVLDAVEPNYKRKQDDHRYILVGAIYRFNLLTDADMPRGEVWIKDVDSGEIYYKFKF